MYARSEDQATGLRKLWPSQQVEIATVAGSPNVLRTQIKMPRRLRRDQVDLYHSLGFFLPLRWHGPRVVSIHDMNVYLNWRSWARPGKFLAWGDLMVQTPFSAKAADRIITISQFSKDMICRMLRVPSSKVSVTPLAPDPYFALPPSAEETAAMRAVTGDSRFVLFVGILSPQKNLATLIRAMAESGLRAKGVKLVIAGSDREGYGATVRRLAAEVGIAEQLVLAGFVSLPMLRALYHDALCLVLPSHGEGFGLPVVEAFAAGAPVLAANRQSLPEVVGDAGLLFEADDVGALAKQLRQVGGDETFRSDLARRGKERSKQFTWRATAEATAQIYEEVLAARRR